MIIVDDRLSLAALAGRRERFGGAADEAVATTWGFHYRLVRALADDRRVGRLTAATPAALRERVLAPPAADLLVLDPRELTGIAAAAAVRHGLNLLAAELVAAATTHQARIALSTANVGRSWPAVFTAEGVDLQIVP
ncbi:hypothetical protein BH20ACT2_BH20ACT2_24010 [soil metagenome]